MILIKVLNKDIIESIVYKLSRYLAYYLCLNWKYNIGVYFTKRAFENIVLT